MSTILRFTTVDVHANPWDAQIACELLKSEGIPAFLASEHHVWANWQFSLALGGVRIQVPAAYRTDALAILARCRAGEFEAALHDELEYLAPVCAGCGAAEFRGERATASVLLSFCAVFLLGLILPPPKFFRCTACGAPAPRES